MPRDLPLLQRRLLPEHAFPSGKLQVTRLDLLLLQPRFVSEPALLWAKRLVKRPLKAMWRFPSPPLSSRLFYASDVLPVIRPDWATDLAQYKLQRIRLHKAEQEFSWS